MWQIKHDAISRKLSKAQEKVWGMLKAEFMKWLFRSALLISLAFNWGITVRTTIQTILTLTRNTQSDLWTSRTLKICHYHNPWVTKPVPCPLFNHWLYFWIVVRVFRTSKVIAWISSDCFESLLLPQRRKRLKAIGWNSGYYLWCTPELFGVNSSI